MSHQTITAKFGNMRKAQEFTVYPHTADDQSWKLQSDRRCVVLRKKNGKGYMSPSMNYPQFGDFLSPKHGGQEVEASPEVLRQLQALPATGKKDT